MNTRTLNRCISLARNLFYVPNSSKKHFTFIVAKNKIISIGWNDGWKTHPIAARYGHRYNGIHSELMAILKVRDSLDNLSQYDMINVRLKQDKSVGNSKPCVCCQKMLKDFGLTNVFYTFGNSNTFKELTQ